MSRGVLLDTSFFLRFLNDTDPLFKNADDYFRYFLKNDFSLFISTISVAEFFPNDSKLFAQADSEAQIEYYLTTDVESIKAFNILKQSDKPLFTIIDLNHTYSEIFGILDL